MAVRRLRTLLGLGGGLWLGLVPLGAHAQPAPEDPVSGASASQGVIELSVIGSSRIFDGVRATIGAHSFAPKTLHWHRERQFNADDLIRETRESSAVLVRGWLDLSDPRHTRLYFADRDAARFLIRDLELSAGFDELDREALSQALELSLRALLEDRMAGLTREEARSLLTPPPPAERPITPESEHLPEQPRVGPGQLAAGVFWQFAKHSSELGFSHGPGLDLAYERALARFRGALWLSGQYQLEQRFRDESIGVSLASLALRAGAGISSPLASGAWLLGARLGGGLDVTRFTPEAGSVEDSAALTHARNLVIPTLTGALLVGSELGARLRLTLGAGADVALTRAHYDLQRGTQRTRVVDTWPLRPGLALGLTWH